MDGAMRFCQTESRPSAGKNCMATSLPSPRPYLCTSFRHVWIDLRGIQDDYMLQKGLDSFENSRRATYVQQRNAIDHPQKFAGH